MKPDIGVSKRPLTHTQIWNSPDRIEISAILILQAKKTRFMHRHHHQKLPHLFLISLFILSGCRDFSTRINPQQDTTGSTVSLAPTLPAANPDASLPAQVFTPLISNGSLPNTLYLPDALPTRLRDSLTLPAGFSITTTLSQPGLHLEVGSQNIVGQWTYALVMAFPARQGGISAAELVQAWQGSGQPLLLSENTLKVLSAWWGSPGEGAIQVQTDAELLTSAWQNYAAWAIIPFEEIQPRWKVIAIEGQSPLRNDFDPASYPLTIPISLVGAADALASFQAVWQPPAGLDPTRHLLNRSPSLLTTLAMTGVTALVRATAAAMETQGITYPARDLGDILRRADLTHISNEVAFSQDCPYPDAFQEGVIFCSRDSYLDLLVDVGTDIVELSGDHFQDWGTDAVFHTLELYKQQGWSYYGGGENLSAGRQPLLVENHGNRLAFIGCNAKGAAFAHASEDNPGAVVCDFDWMEQEITRLRAAGYLPIATFQHFEYYTYSPQPDQIADFGRLARAGAVIVSGSQAHQPQGMAFENSQGADAFIHYGLGNLFFDQYDLSPACRQAFIDRHVFYNGRYLGVELLPILFEDYARARPMTPAETDELLQSVFSASGW